MTVVRDSHNRCAVCGRPPLDECCHHCHRAHDHTWATEHANRLVVDPDDLADRRRRRGWSQLALAKRLDVSESTLGAWERCQYTPTIDQQIQWANALGAHPGPILLSERPA